MIERAMVLRRMMGALAVVTTGVMAAVMKSLYAVAAVRAVAATVVL